MNEGTIEHREFREYLLGVLPVDRRMTLEKAIFASPESYDDLLAAEEALFEDHAFGLLSPDEQKAFELRRSTSFLWQERADLRRLLRQGLHPARKEETAWATFPRLMARRVGDMLGTPAVRWAVGLAAVLVVALTGREWWLQRTQDSRLLADVSLVVDADIPGTRGGRIDVGTRGVEPGSSGGEGIEISGTDQYAVVMAPHDTLYFYVLQWDTSGNVTALFPNPEVSPADNPVAPAPSFRIPPEPDWLAIDKDTGVETIGILASSARLGEADSLLSVIRYGAYADKMVSLSTFKAMMRNAERDQHDGRIAREFSFFFRK